MASDSEGQGRMSAPPSECQVAPSSECTASSLIPPGDGPDLPHDEHLAPSVDSPSVASTSSDSSQEEKTVVHSIFQYIMTWQMIPSNSQSRFKS